MVEYNRIAKQYENDVLSGTIPAGKLLQLAVQRQRNDLATGHKRGIYFDHDAGQAILDFADLVNIAPEKPIVLAPSQVWELYVFYGWKRDDGRRRFRFKYKSCARGNGKTPLESLQVLYHLIIDGPDKAEVYVSATKEEQAKIAFNDAKNMLEFSPDLQEDLQSSAETIYNIGNKAKFGFLTSNPKTADGTRPTFAIIDEYHEFENDDMLVKLKTGLIKTTNPILNIVTTRGSNKAGPCYQAEVNFYIPILKNTISNDATFVLIYSLDEADIVDSEDDEKPNAPWKDPRSWQKANPMLGHLLRVDDMAEAMKEATQKGGRTLVGFKTLNLNIWEESDLTWIDAEKWTACAEPIPDHQILGKLCYAGLDLATKADFNAFVPVFPLPDGRFYIKPIFWIPEDAIAVYEAKGIANIRQWVDKGWVRVTPGNYVDYEVVLDDILEFFAQYELISIAKDAWNSAWMYQQLNSRLEPVWRVDKYIERVSDYSQTTKHMTSPTVYVEDLVDEQKLVHDGNPVMAWMMSNVVLETTGKMVEDLISGKPVQSRKPSKLKSQKKIDGPIALVMALGEYLTWNWEDGNDGPSQYETEQIFVF